MIEEKHRLVRLLTEYIDGPGLTVVIGAEHPRPGLRQFSLVASTYVDGDSTGTVGLIGPLRMQLLAWPSRWWTASRTTVSRVLSHVNQTSVSRGLLIASASPSTHDRRRLEQQNDGACGRRQPDAAPATARPTRRPSAATDAAGASATDYYDRLLRKTAEFDNYRKRIERERREHGRPRRRRCAASTLLPIVDDLERALKVGRRRRQRRRLPQGRRTDPPAAARPAASAAACTPIEAVGADFDPHLHQAVDHEARRGHARRRGHRGAPPRATCIGERLLRPAMVKVAQGREQARLLRGARRREDRERPGDQERLPQAGAEVPSRPQPRQQGRRGEVQGSGRGLRGARGCRQARRLRPVRPRGRERRAGGAGFDPTVFAGFEDIFGGLGDIFGFGDSSAAGAGAAARSAAPTCATTSRSRFEESAKGVETTIQIPRQEPCETCSGIGRGARHQRRRAARSARAAARCATSRASSSCRAPAASAAAPGNVITEAVQDLPRARGR